jgi:hypothetical protein
VWTDAGTAGAFTWLTLLPNQRRAWYWSALVRHGEPLLHVADLEVPLPPSGLRVRTTGLWADHHCEVPFEQWTVRNECYAVALDDPDDALGRAYGTSTPIAFDIEWYATDPTLDVTNGYEQAGVAHAIIELAGKPMTLEGDSSRTHTWGAWSVPDDPPPTGLHAPLVLDGPDGPRAVQRTLTPVGWRTTAAG